jgi:hypothetical protein
VKSRFDGSWRFGERTRPACWRRRLADTSEVCGGTPRTACGPQALPGKYRPFSRCVNITFSYTLRSGDFRILFEVCGSMVVIRTIRDRKEAYE